MTGWSLRARLVAAFGLTFAAFSLVLLVLVPVRLDRQAREVMNGEAHRIAELLAATVVGGLEFDDATFVREQLGNLERLPDATRAAVFRGDRTIALWERNLSEGEAEWSKSASESLIVTVPVVAPGGTRGELVVEYSLHRLHQLSSSNRTLGGLFAMGTLGIGMCVAWLLGTVFARPLRRLTQDALAVAEGRESLDVWLVDDTSVHAGSDHEARRLQQALRLMAERIVRQVAATEEERRRAMEAEERAVQASSAKSVFLANMSHELRTPLNAIIGYAEILEDESDDHGLDWMREDLERITGAGRHLLGLIADVLDLSKIEAGFMEVSPSPTDMDRLVAELGDAVQGLIARNHNVLQVELSEPLGQRRIDPVRVRQCLINLLGNAAKFTRQGRVVIRGLPQERLGQDWLCIEVEDNGIGMSSAQLSRIFRPFTQAEVTTNRTYGGSGLGLTLTRRLCELMGGSIEVESTLGEGSTFRLLLPAPRANGAQESAA